MLRDYRIIDVVLGMVVTNMMDVDAVNLYLVGPSSSGKTEILRAVAGFKKIKELSSLTANTLFSGWGGQASSGRSGLVFDMQEEGVRIVIMKDFTSVLGLRAEVRQEIIGQIREISDGYYSRGVGNKLYIEWRGRLAFLAGVTPVIDRMHAVNGVLGERFLFYRIPPVSREDLALKSMDNADRQTIMRDDIERTVIEFLDGFTTIETKRAAMDTCMKDKMAKLVDIVSEGRSHVARKRITHDIEYVPEPEMPARLVQQMVNLATGIAAVQGKKEIDSEIFDIICKIGCDNMPSIRLKLCRLLWDEHIQSSNPVSLADVSTISKLPKSTVQFNLEDMHLLGIASKDRANKCWQLTPRWIDMIKITGIFDKEYMPTEWGWQD